MARSSRTGGKRGAATPRKANPIGGRNPKSRSQKALNKKASRTKSSVTDLKKQIEHQARELEEARQQQAASSRVLHIIGTSPGALTPVFHAIVKNAVELCGARLGAVFKMEGDLLHLAADYNFGAAHRQLFETMYPMTPNRGHISGRAILTRSTVQIPDINADEDYRGLEAKQSGFRSLLAAPLLKGDRAIGAIVIYKAEPGTFTARQLALLQNFAAQAVIAIENARLFSEVEARTRDLSEALTYQSGSANILSVIASSPTDVAPVLKAIVESACELCGAYDAVVLLKEGDYLLFGAHHGSIPIEIGSLLISRNWTPGLAVIEQKPVHIHDLLSSEGDQVPEAQRRAREFGYRTIVSVPMLREKESIGVLALRRAEAHPFSDKQIALLQTFADQAVIAIGNVRLFEEVQARTRELTKSLEELRTTQDRLVQTQKLALLGQLTAGIAHEIKNPLNFVNNFSGISAELIDELQDTLKGVSLDDKARAEIEELADTLKGNFDKVVHHGRRADAIVKNMLQHSREGSGEHRIIDINALVEESLNLAWHGARAETQGFEIKLKQSFDPSAGGADVFPQDIRRALLNLIANGFYATKRKAEVNDGDYEPTLAASTKNLGDHVEIRIRDNGTGITPDVKEKMFEPFFTTKPTGEGTGLGLSISHDIVVKQHAGTIEVETQPGAFTEIRIILPRTPAFV